MLKKGPVTIQRTTGVHPPFGTDKSVPYEHAGRRPVHPTFVNPLKHKKADDRPGKMKKDIDLGAVFGYNTPV